MATQEDVLRLYLQSILSRRVVSHTLARVLWEKCIAAVQECNDQLPPMPVQDRDWASFLAKINEALNPIDLEFRSLRDEDDGKEYYILVNRKGDLIAQAATLYTPAEIAYFNALVEQIMLAPKNSYSISSTGALREVTHVKGMTKLQAEQFLDNLVGSRWLVRSKRGRYSLSTRTILELESYLTTNYPDEVSRCTLCKEILTKGFACLTEDCTGRAHPHCLKNARGKCPTCQQDWPKSTKETSRLIPIGEAAIKHGEEFARVQRHTATPSDDDEEMEDFQPKKSRQKKGKGKARARDTDSEGEAVMSDSAGSE